MLDNNYSPLISYKIALKLFVELPDAGLKD